MELQSIKIKRLAGSAGAWIIEDVKKPIDGLTIGDFEKAASLCKNCEAFEIR